MKVLLWTSGISYVIIGLNYVLREVCIRLVNWIGYGTHTEALIRTTFVTFFVIFLNTAILVPLTDANFTE